MAVGWHVTKHAARRFRRRCGPLMTDEEAATAVQDVLASKDVSMAGSRDGKVVLEAVNAAMTLVVDPADQSVVTVYPSDDYREKLAKWQRLTEDVARRRWARIM